jgi:hypothetical protein
MRRLGVPVLTLAGLLAVGCNHEEGIPTAPSDTTTNSNTNTSSSNNTNQNDNSVVVIIVIPPGTGGGGGTNPTPPGTRPPDPPAGQVLPLPAYAEGVVRAVGTQAATLLAQSCIEQGGSFAFLDLVVDTLRRQDARFGYACRHGDCLNVSPDRIAYHATAGPTTPGVTGVHTVDIIESYCLAPAIGFLNEGFQPTGRWSSRGRF